MSAKLSAMRKQAAGKGTAEDHALYSQPLSDLYDEKEKEEE